MSNLELLKALADKGYIELCTPLFLPEWKVVYVISPFDSKLVNYFCFDEDGNIANRWEGLKDE